MQAVSMQFSLYMKTCISLNLWVENFNGVAMPYQLPDLPYDFSALEPVISEEIMRLHYTKHHQAYVTNLNTALEKYHEAEQKKDVAAMIAQQPAIRFNGGGHVNHSIFWTNLAPQSKGGGGAPAGDLAQLIVQEFGSIESFKEKMQASTVAIQGSGWGWLGWNKVTGRLMIAACANQDPLSTIGLVPLLGIDVWEHAYYLQYKNVRADYVKNIWNIVNWKNVEERLTQARK
jgi:Fe-Mn family superoxide dismutase